MIQTDMSERDAHAALPVVAFTGRFAAAADCPRHTHTAHELVIVMEGACHIEVSGLSLAGVRNTLFILPALAQQYQKTHGFTRASYIGFWANPDLLDCSARVLQLPNDDLAVRLIEDICALPTALGRIGAGLLLALLCRIGELEGRNEENDRIPSDVLLARRYLQQNVIRMVRVEEVARHVCVSVSHLTALFRRYVGCGPLHYQQTLRMALAEHLLTDPHQSVEQIATSCGYDDVAYFTRVFRHSHGQSPRAWRQGLKRRQPETLTFLSKLADW